MPHAYKLVRDDYGSIRAEDRIVYGEDWQTVPGNGAYCSVTGEGITSGGYGAVLIRLEVEGPVDCICPPAPGVTCWRRARRVAIIDASARVEAGAAWSKSCAAWAKAFAAWAKSCAARDTACAAWAEACAARAEACAARVEAGAAWSKSCAAWAKSCAAWSTAHTARVEAGAAWSTAHTARAEACAAWDTAIRAAIAKAEGRS